MGSFYKFGIHVPLENLVESTTPSGYNSGWHARHHGRASKFRSRGAKINAIFAELALLVAPTWGHVGPNPFMVRAQFAR